MNFILDIGNNFSKFTVFESNQIVGFGTWDSNQIIDEFDKRRGKNFLKTFPEMEDFYQSCKKLI